MTNLELKDPCARSTFAIKLGVAMQSGFCPAGLALALRLCAALPVRGDSIPPQPVDGKIQWVYSYAEGQRLARANHKPLFVVFRCER